MWLFKKKYSTSVSNGSQKIPLCKSLAIAHFDDVFLARGLPGDVVTEIKIYCCYFVLCWLFGRKALKLALSQTFSRGCFRTSPYRDCTTFAFFLGLHGSCAEARFTALLRDATHLHGPGDGVKVVAAGGSSFSHLCLYVRQY